MDEVERAAYRLPGSSFYFKVLGAFLFLTAIVLGSKNETDYQRSWCRWR
jgi:hypothetical protein